MGRWQAAMSGGAIFITSYVPLFVDRHRCVLPLAYPGGSLAEVTNQLLLSPCRKVWARMSSGLLR